MMRLIEEKRIIKESNEESIGTFIRNNKWSDDQWKYAKEDYERQYDRSLDKAEEYLSIGNLVSISIYDNWGISSYLINDLEQELKSQGYDFTISGPYYSSGSRGTPITSYKILPNLSKDQYDKILLDFSNKIKGINLNNWALPQRRKFIALIQNMEEMIDKKKK